MTHKTFFIADLHFGHQKILEFSRGQFKTIEEHDEALIDNWNSVVGKKDTVWVLGDFCFGKKNLALAGRLKGVKKLVMGNHDILPMENYLKYFSKVYGCIKWKNCVLTHMPVLFTGVDALNRFDFNIHGHLHNTIIKTESKYGDHLYKDDRYKCVSCEQINYTPITYEELFK